VKFKLYSLQTEAALKVLRKKEKMIMKL